MLPDPLNLTQHGLFLAALVSGEPATGVEARGAPEAAPEVAGRPAA